MQKISQIMSYEIISESRNTEIPDSVFAMQALTGDERGFEQLVHRYSQPLFRFIYHFLQNYDQSCDVLQKVFLKLYLSLSELDMDQPFRGWLFQVARNYCIDEYRSHQRRLTCFFSEISSDLSGECETSLLEAIPDPHPLPEETMEEDDLRKQLLLAIRSLPARYQPIVFLRYARQLSFSEISQLLGISVSTAKTCFHRAKCKLRIALEGSNLLQFDGKCHFF